MEEMCMARSARLALSVSAALIAALCTALILPGWQVGAQETAISATVPSPGEIQLRTVPHAMPAAPASMRLLRIRVVSGGKIPLNTHPGPEYFAIEAGTLTVRVNGKASIIRNGATTAETAPTSKDFTLTVGDQILFEAECQLQYSNVGKDPVAILAAVILPIGHQHPPGITYVNGTPGANDIAGVSFQVLGDGVADTMPKTASFIIDRQILAPEAAIPASPYPSMLVMEAGTLNFTVNSGDVEVSTLTNPGLQPPATQGSSFHVVEGDALFFPHGMTEAARPSGSGTLVLLRASIVAAPNAGTPIPNDPLTGKITVNAAGAASSPAPAPATTTTPTPQATQGAQPTATPAQSTATAPAPTATPTQAATAAPTATKPAGIAVGATVTVTENSVNLRDQPATSGNVVESLTQGQQLTVIGGPQTADGYTWWQVQDPATGTSGWVAADFLQPAS